MTSDSQPTTRDVLQRLSDGDLDVATASKLLAGSENGIRSAVTADATIDLDRPARCGFPEVVYCEGKSAESVVAIFEKLAESGQECFGTRASVEQAEAVSRRFPNARHNPIARTIRVSTTANESRERDANPSAGKLPFVAVISAGTTDQPVAEEAIETLDWMGCRVEKVVDVGVAGPHRLIESKSIFVDAAAVVVVAGMEGALPSVVGGHVACPVIAVPTSVGYGANFGGLSALLGMLNSCASNVTVVNIDAGFKGGYVAGLIAKGVHDASR